MALPSPHASEFDVVLQRRRNRRRIRYGRPGQAKSTGETRAASVEHPRTRALQARANEFFAAMRLSGAPVRVEVTDSGRLSATAQGLTVGDVPIGKITIDVALMRLLDEHEIDFVIAHEVVHIAESHVIGRGAFVLLRAVFEAEAARDPGIRAALIGWDMCRAVMASRRQLPPSAELLQAQELDADYFGVLLTGNPSAAFSALSKLTGGDDSSPSHIWEVFERNVPVMTMRERIDALDERIRRRVPHLLRVSADFGLATPAQDSRIPR